MKHISTSQEPGTEYCVLFHKNEVENSDYLVKFISHGLTSSALRSILEEELQHTAACYPWDPNEIVDEKMIEFTIKHVKQKLPETCTLSYQFVNLIGTLEWTS